MMGMPFFFPALQNFSTDLVQEGLLTKEQLAVAKVSQENLGEDLASILVRKGFVKEEDLLLFLSRRLKIDYISLKRVVPDPALLREISATTARRLHLLPIKKENGKVCVAMANPLDTLIIEDLKQSFGEEILPFLCHPKELQEAILKAYEVQDRKEEAGKPAGILEVVSASPEAGPELKKMEEIASGPKVIAAVNDLITKAWSESASDIHLEPFQDRSRIRYRVDGVLNERGALARHMHLALVSRLKIMAALDIAEHRIPQDGRVRIRMVGRTLDMRVSTCPTQYGEKIVLRLLSKDEIRSVEDLGFSAGDRKIFSDIIGRSHGIFLATGPTGSGKSTTLYAALARINSPERNIIAIEDPIESEIEGVNQIAVNPKVGMDFAAILRSVLRQDPDVVMIGEIRDAETASIAVRAAITGHLVLSTLHTNTAVGAISRLLDLGVEPFLVSSALQGVLAQRLVRKICAHCKEKLEISEKRYGPYARLVRQAFRGKGCSRCFRTGYAGRIGIFEITPVTDRIREMIYHRKPDIEIEAELRKMGFNDMKRDGFRKIEAGLTTIEEVLRVTEEE